MDKTHVLLIDDDLDEFEFFLMAVERMPALFKCTYASSGYEGIKMLDEIQPDYIFIDMNMPRCNGLECIQAIKKKQNCYSIPLILYSTSIDEKLQKQARGLGVADCLQKPFSPDVLSTMLRELAHIHGDFIEN